MRHEKPAQYGENGPWHYVSMKAGQGGYPIGYCTQGCTHATAEEAHEHYRQYVLDHLRDETYGGDVQYRCEVEGCDAWTQKGMAEPDGFTSHHLCDSHRNREAYEAAFYPPDRPIREAWVS